VGSSVILPSPGQPTTGPLADFVTAAVPSRVTFAFQNIAPPTPLYIQRDDVLAVVLLESSFLADSFMITGRLLRAAPDVGGQPDQPPTGPGPTPGAGALQIVPINFTRAEVANNEDLIVIPLQEGYLLSLAITPSGEQDQGSAYAAVYVVRGKSNNIVNVLANAVACLCYGPVGTGSPVAWPYGTNQKQLADPGTARVLTVANPAAGADWTANVPTLAAWRIWSVRATLTTSATAGNRIPVLRVATGGTIVFEGIPNQVVAASSTAEYAGTPSPTSAGANVPHVQVAVPGVCRVNNGANSVVVSTLTGNIQAADQWSNIALLIEEFLCL